MVDIDYVIWNMPIQQVFKGVAIVQQRNSETLLLNRTEKKVQMKLLDAVIEKGNKNNVKYT